MKIRKYSIVPLFTICSSFIVPSCSHYQEEYERFYEERFLSVVAQRGGSIDSLHTSETNVGRGFHVYFQDGSAVHFSTSCMSSNELEIEMLGAKRQPKDFKPRRDSVVLIDDVVRVSPEIKYPIKSYSSLYFVIDVSHNTRNSSLGHALVDQFILEYLLERQYNMFQCRPSMH